ncbi:hypothetical protein AXF42_Ash010346 [Apostasia shenzhenica]|uniref:Protein SNOWY COTYLEDON 3 n=1 Tax=Apostasia shenzhenica TaxID=1088818 RepID=A0A2I0BDQ6_9ASPA|nr:hypothetical protein AXF42_Ash010346 [Apostasia shenzhenica]
MVAAVAATGCGDARPFPRTPSALTPLEKDNASTQSAAAGGLRPRSRETPSRYMSSSVLSASKPNSSCISTVSSSSSSSSSSTSSTPRRFASPIHSPIPKTPLPLPKIRSQTVDRTHAAAGSAKAGFEANGTAKAAPLRKTTRSLSVSFQGESFVFQTSKIKSSPRKSTTECRKPYTAASGAENSHPGEQQLRRWPPTRAKDPNLFTRSLDYSDDRNEPILLTVRLLQRSLMLDEAVNFRSNDPPQSPDSVSFSSGSNSSLHGAPPKLRNKPRGICVPARFRQECNGLPRPHPESPRLASPRVSSPRHGFMKASPRDVSASRVRSNIFENYSTIPPPNPPSILSFASEVRRTKKGESRIEEAHLLRLLHNRYLQWRYLNARARDALSTQLIIQENNICNAWITISELRDSAMTNRIKLLAQMQNIKLASILQGQIAHLEEWSALHKDHESSLLGAFEALKASTLRLPVVGAKVDIREVKDAIASSVGVMQAIATSICSFLSKVEGASSHASQLEQAAAYERVLLDRASYHLSLVAALHVKQCSLQGYMQQSRRKM